MLPFYRSFLLITLILTVTFLGTSQAQYLNKTKYPAQNILNNTNVFENNIINPVSRSKNIIHKSKSLNAIFSEDFDGIPGPTAGGPGTYLFPSGWVLANVDNLVPSGAVSYVNDAWERREDFNFNVADSAVFSTSWYVPAGQADDWMITPAINLGEGSTLKWNAVAYDPLYPDGYEVRISTTTQDVAGCLANPVLLSVASENSAWTERTVDLALAGYANQTVYIAFRNHSTDMFLLLIDDILVEGSEPYDVQLASVLQPSEYTMIPAWQNYPLELGGSVRNNGTSDITNVVLTAKVYQNSTLVHTEVGAPIASISAGSSVPITLNSYVPGDTGIVSIDYLVTINEIEQDSSNNSGSISAPYFTENEFARDDNMPVGSLGIGAGDGGELGQTFVMNTSGYIRGVKLYFTRSYTTEPVFANIRSIVDGLPSDLIAVTDTFYAPDDSARWISLNISGGEAALAADTFLVTVNEVDSTLALGSTTNIFTTGTEWVNWPTSPFGGWANVEAFGASFAKPFMLRPLIYELTIPVELVSFNASLNQSNVSLSWITATELNNRGFSVQRKVSNQWQDVVFVEGQGTTTEKNSYSYIDDISSIENNGKIYYRLKQFDYDGSFSFSNEVLVMITPAEYKLSQNYPNPFNPVTRINFQLPYDSHVTLKIYDVVGSEVATLVNEIKVAGNYNFDFNASSLASGVYYYKLQAGDFVQNKKMILLK
jgi:hypothetical protein